LNVTPDGKISRAEAAIDQLKELNPYVEVNVVKTPVTIESLKNYTVVFVTELLFPISKLKEMDLFCRSQNPAIGFIFTLTLGLYGFTFVDLGPKMYVKDSTGEMTIPFVVALITQGNPGIVRLHEDKKHNLSDDDYVKFKEVEGMTELNTAEPMQIKVIDKLSFKICDTSKFKEFIRGGIVEKVKVPVELTFKNLGDSIVQPLKSPQDCLINADLRLFGRAEQLHIGLSALLEYHEKHLGLPQLNNEEHAKEVLEIAKRQNEERKKVLAYAN
jgi:ubiquitin-activating enzyme E1